MSTWDEMYAGGLALAEPQAWVVETADAIQSAGVSTILDLGCGTGRHLVWLGRRGFELWGTDIAPHGLRHSRAWLEQEGLPVRLALADMQSIPFAAASFDAILSIQVLYHATRSGMQTALAGIERLLKPDGLFIGSFLSTRAWKHDEGEMLESETWVQPRGPEAGVPHHYCDEEETRALLQAFTIVELRLDEYLDAAGDRQSHWEFVVRANAT
jgi:SAM-dependent methyltransferase